MGLQRRAAVLGGIGIITAAGMLAPAPAGAASAAEIERDATAALQHLIASNEGAKILSEKAVAVLVFPQILKAGLLVGGAYGEGALTKGGNTVAYYSSMAGSYGLQIGAQTFGYALFFMSEEALAYIDKSDGWEVGVGPSLVVMDQTMASKLSSTTIQDDVYAFIFSQEGLMAGGGIEGSKITRINP